MSFIVRNVSKNFGSLTVLDGIDLEVKTGELVSLVGPSGAGKTTLLKLCAGLMPPDTGTIMSDSTSGSEPILVFQDYLLFPYMTVFENVAFGLKARKLRKREITRRVEDMLGFFGIDEKHGEYPATLSGGQRQRVALARALVLRPSLLLLDEPFANLDQNLKMDTAMFLKRTQREFGNVTTLCVTHDLEEACAMSDRVGVMLNGRILDYGGPERLYTAPANVETARFLGTLNTIESALFDYFSINSTLDRVYVLPSALDVSEIDAASGYTGQNAAATVKDISFTGKTYAVTIEVYGARMTARMVNTPPSPGSPVSVEVCSYLEPRGAGLNRVKRSVYARKESEAIG